MKHSHLFSRFVYFPIASIILLPLHAAIAESYITLNDFNGPPIQVEVSGGGWTPGETVSLYLNTVSGAPKATVIAGSDSFFAPTQVPIPFNTPQGPLPIIAVGSISSAQRSNSYYVVSFSPTITVTGNSTPGSTLTINGSGFAPNEPVRFLLNGNILGETIANSAGNFTGANAILPFIGSGTYVLHANGQISNANAIEYFYVGGFFPSITPSEYFLLPTQTLHFSGSGFAPGETIHICEGQNQTALGTIVADNNGSFVNAGNIVIPVHATGTKTFRLAGQTSKGSASVDITVGTFIPLVTPSAHFFLPDQVITFSGRGFAGDEVVRVIEGQTELAQFKTDTEGNFTALGSVKIPFHWTNSSRTFTLIGQMSGATGDVMIAVGQFNSLVSPSTYHITPGHEITFTGDGFAANEVIYVRGGPGPGAKILNTIIADATGSFADAGAVIIPFTLADSSITFYLEGQSSNTVATVIITVAPFSPQVSPSSYYILPGERISFTGTGFGKLEDIAVTQGQTGPRLSTISADATGGFEDAGEFAIPFGWFDTQTLLFTGLSSHATSEADITIAPFNPSLTPSTYYVAPGQPILISGDGFAPDETVSITMNGGNKIDIKTNGFGAFADVGPYIAPLSGTTLHFTALGEHSNTAIGVDITLAGLYPQVIPDQWYLSSGSPILFSGSGFGPHEQVIMKKGTTTIGTIATDASGSFDDHEFMTEFGSMREETYSFTGVESGAIALVIVTIAGLQPYIALDNYYLLPGTDVLVSGVGFSPHEEVAVTIGSTTVTASADKSGAVSNVAITLPFGLPGPIAEVMVTGKTSGAVAMTTLTLAPFSPMVSPSAWYTPMGSFIIFTGEGFAPNETVSIMMNGQSTSTVNASGIGAFTSSPIQIPYAVELATFTFTGTLSNGVQVIPITVAQLYPGMELSIYYALGGTPITVTGMGFASNEQIALTFDGQSFGDLPADGNGNFIFNSTVPYRPAGEKIVQAKGMSSGASTMVTFTEPPVYSASAQLGSYAGAPGAAVTFVGSGYIPGETINIMTDRTGTDIVHTFTTDASGSFNNSVYIIPPDFTEGPLTFTIGGAWSFTPVSITYYVTGM